MTQGDSVLKTGWTRALKTREGTWLVCASWLGGDGAQSSLVVEFTTNRISKDMRPPTQGPTWDGVLSNLRSVFHRDRQVCGTSQACAVYNLHGCSRQPCCN